MKALLTCFFCFFEPIKEKGLQDGSPIILTYSSDIRWLHESGLRIMDVDDPVWI